MEISILDKYLGDDARALQGWNILANYFFLK